MLTNGAAREFDHGNRMHPRLSTVMLMRYSRSCSMTRLNFYVFVRMMSYDAVQYPNSNEDSDRTWTGAMYTLYALWLSMCNPDDENTRNDLQGDHSVVLNGKNPDDSVRNRCKYSRCILSGYWYSQLSVTWRQRVNSLMSWCCCRIISAIRWTLSELGLHSTCLPEM